MAFTFNILDFTFSLLGELTMLIKQDHLGRNFTAFLIAISAVYIRTPWPTQILVLIFYDIMYMLYFLNWSSQLAPKIWVHIYLKR